MTKQSDDPAKHGRLTQDAFARGRTALGAGQLREALRWLNRAHRLSPDDLTILLTLASVSIGTNPPVAAALFEKILAAADIREAWLGLATARRQMGDIDAARAALHQALSRHAPHPGMTAVADQVARDSEAPGWCGLSGDGVLTVRPQGREQVYVYIDGVRTKAGPMPPAWPRASAITVRAGKQDLIGSPISPKAIARVEGFVDVWDAGLRGWAWQPGDPEIDPVLTVMSGGRTLQVVATQPANGIPGLAPLARPRTFFVPASPLPGGGAPVHVRGRDERDLLGSPVPWADAVGTSGSGKPGTVTPAPGSLTVLIQPRDDDAALVFCLRSVLLTVDPTARIIVLGERRDDAAAEIARHGARVTWLRGEIGPALVPRPGDDIVVLDGAGLVPQGWLDRLRQAAYSAPDIGTVTPFSNSGEAAYPVREGVDLVWFASEPHWRRNEFTPESCVAWLDAMAFAANGVATVELSHGGGPCLFIRGDCLAAIGKLRSAMFAQGDGGHEDFCHRATEMSWRHVALTGLFVGQRRPERPTGGSAPSPAASRQLERRNNATLSQLHPGRHTRSTAYRSARLLDPGRRGLDLARWDRPRVETAVIVTHDEGGGVGRRVDAEVAARTARGHSTIVLRPERLASGVSGVRIDEGGKDRFPNLIFAMPAEQSAVLRLLRAAQPIEAGLHHFLNHDPSVIETVRSLGVPYETHTHDYAWFCPRVALLGRGDRYCGEPEPAECETCVAETGSYLNEDISVTDLLARSGNILAHAARVIAPSDDAAGRITRHFPDIPAVSVPHEDDSAMDEPPPTPLVRGTLRVCVAGAIGLHKGYYVLLDCALDARARGLDLTFLVAGTTIDDQALIDTGRVFVTGRYDADEAVDLIRAQDAALALLPSICPETWCLGLTELWRAGLRVAAFDIGAPAERIRRTGRGFLLPLGLSSGEINDKLLNAARGG